MLSFVISCIQHISKTWLFEMPWTSVVHHFEKRKKTDISPPAVEKYCEIELLICLQQNVQKTLDVEFV